MDKVPFIDTTGVQYFTSTVQHFLQKGKVLISGLNPQPREMLEKSGLVNYIGEKNIFENIDEAVNYAVTTLVDEDDKQNEKIIV